MFLTTKNIPNIALITSKYQNIVIEYSITTKLIIFIVIYFQYKLEHCNIKYSINKDIKTLKMYKKIPNIFAHRYIYFYNTRI